MQEHLHRLCCTRRCTGVVQSRMIPRRARLRVRTDTHAHPGPHARILALVWRAQELFTLCFLSYLFYSLLRNRSLVSTRVGGGGGSSGPYCIPTQFHVANSFQFSLNFLSGDEENFGPRQFQRSVWRQLRKDASVFPGEREGFGIVIVFVVVVVVVVVVVLTVWQNLKRENWQISLCVFFLFQTSAWYVRPLSKCDSFFCQPGLDTPRALDQCQHGMASLQW